MPPSTAYRVAVALEELSKIYPQWRFGQLVSNVAQWAKGAYESAVWDVEDEEFLRAAEQHLKSRPPTAKAGEEKHAKLVDDKISAKVARDIAKKIESDVQYAG